MKIYYIATEGINSTVFYSQVFSYVKRLREEKFIDAELILYQNILFRPNKQVFSYFNISWIKIVWYKDKFNIKTLCKIIEKNKIRKIVLHCRNPIAADLALKLKKKLYKLNISILYDVRGAVEEEKKFFQDEVQYELYKKLNDILFNSNIFFSFISENLYEYYSSKYKISDEKKIICNSAYDDDLFSFSKYDTNIKYSNKIIYVGGNQKYQNIDSIIKLANKIQKNFLVVTTKKLNFSRNKFIDFKYGLRPNELSIEMLKCSYGILYRENYLFNMVATPTKVSEYWGAGLKVIAVNNAGAYTEVIQNNNMLGVVDELKNIENFSFDKISIQNRNYIENFARNNFSMSKNILKYIELYNRM